MAKRIVADEAQFSRIAVSGAGKVKNAVPVAPEVKDGDAFSASHPKGRSGRHIEDEIQDDKGIIVADAEQASPDSAVAASEQPMLLAQADAPLTTPGSDPAKADLKGEGHASSSNSGWWLLGGLGLAAGGAGIGIALSGDDNGNGTTNEAPVISSNGGGATAAVNTAENQTAVTTVTSSDVDAGDGKTFSITGGADAALFAINPSTGVLTFLSAPNYEALADAGANNVYDVQVTVTDTAGLTDVQALAVSVTGVNDNNPVFTSAATANAAENSSAVLAVAATDADLPGQTVSYSITGGADQTKFTINATTGALAFVAAPDFEVPTDADGNNSYLVQVTANDGNGGSTVQTITATVTDVNEAPVITSIGGNAVALNVIENMTAVADVDANDVDAGQAITYSLSGADSSLFTIDPDTGVVAFATPPNFEAPTDSGADNIYDFTVTATDNGNGSLTDTQDFAVTVTNVNESVVVEASGAWIDLNANGVRDAEDTTRADFTPGTGNVDLTANPVIIHFNNIPNGDLDLTGFGTDDLIEIDVQAFIDNGHNALQILTRPNIVFLDEFTTTGTISVGATKNWLNGSRYGNSNQYTNFTGATTTAYISLYKNSSRLSLSSYNGSTSATSLKLASALPTDIPLQQMVDFVNLPTPQDPVHVIVERNGAVIDIDGDGVRDNGEKRLADFSSGGSADLAGATPVIIHFNDIPVQALDLTGFGTDDKIEFDVLAMQQNSILSSSATQLAYISAATSTMVRYAFNSSSAWPVILTVLQAPGAFTTFNGGTNTNAYALQIPIMWTTISSRASGAFAYWTDSGNALNSANNILPEYTGGNTSAVLATLNSNAPHSGQIDFLWPVSVVVDSTGAWIDNNANGFKDADDTDSANVTADLFSNPVTIHFNGLPSAPIDLTGFGSDDRVVIDVDAMRNGITNKSVATQSLSTRTTWTDSAGFTGVSRLNSAGSFSAVFHAGGILKYGHTKSITNVISTGFTTVKYHYTATLPNEGTIASNAGALANHFQQVDFVYTPTPI